MKATDNRAIRIGAWRVDPTLNEMSRDGSTVKLERRLMQLLQCLAGHAGQVVSVEELLNQVWAGVVVTPDSVYHAVASLRRLLGDDAKEPTYIVNIPRRGYRLVAPVAPWIDAPNVTIQNSLKSSVGPAQAVLTVARTGSPWRRPAIVLSIVLIVALGYVVVDRFWLPKSIKPQNPATATTTAPSDKSIAVLPFTDMSESKDQEYFADGMTEEILDLLATIPTLKVTGRTSSFQFKGKNEDLRVIAAKLGVAYVLEGSVRKSGDRLRVAAQLIDARDGTHRWSGAYDRDVGDALKMQDEIAAGLVRALQVTVGVDQPRPPPDLGSGEAYDLFLRGRHAFDRFDKAGLESAEGYFQQALAIDPSLVRAAEWLAAAQEFVAEYGLVPPREGYERARASAQRALKLEARSAMAHSLLISIYTTFDWDWAAAAEESERALALEPRNTFVTSGVSDFKKAQGDLDGAARLITAALARDPLFAAWHGVLGMIWYRSDRLAEAEAELHKALEISPSYTRGRRRLGQILLAEGKLDAALSEMRHETPDGGRDLGLAIVYHAMKRTADSDAALAQLTKDRADDRAYQIAEAHAYRAELDQAFAWLDRAYRQKDVELFWIKHDPLLRSLEGDPRFKMFLRRMGLPQ